MVKSRVVIAVSPDAALRRTLRGAMIAAGAEVRVAAGPDELGDDGGPLAANLLAYHVTGEADVAAMADLAGRLPDGGKVMALLRRGDLAASVDAMRAHPRVASAVSIDPPRPAELTQVAARLLDGDVFGLEKVLPWGVRVHSLRVGDHEEKAAAMLSISAFTAAIGLHRYHRERIERCSDEMMMNAIYDAPPGAHPAALPRARAREVEAARPGSRAWSPRLDEKGAQPGVVPAERAVVEFACDGQRFAIAVRDSHGRFRRDALIANLHRCLRAAEPVQSESGGAGLGLYLLSRSSSALLFNLLPGAATECICVFDLEAARIEIDQIGVYQEQVDEDGRLARRSDRAGHPAPRRRRVADAPVARASGIEPRSAAGLAAVCIVGLAMALGAPPLSMAGLRRAVLTTVSWARNSDAPTGDSCQLRPSLSRSHPPVGTR
jgi:hypothetical protein